MNEYAKVYQTHSEYFERQLQEAKHSHAIAAKGRPPVIPVAASAWAGEWRATPFQADNKYDDGGIHGGRQALGAKISVDLGHPEIAIDSTITRPRALVGDFYISEDIAYVLPGTYSATKYVKNKSGFGYEGTLGMQGKCDQVATRLQSGNRILVGSATVTGTQSENSTNGNARQERSFVLDRCFLLVPEWNELVVITREEASLPVDELAAKIAADPSSYARLKRVGGAPLKPPADGAKKVNPLRELDQ